MANEQKTPFGQSQNEFARGKALDAIQQLGRSLPCSVISVQGSIVRVKFEVQSPFTLYPVTIPIIGSEYIRLPIQPGCKGLAIAADAYLGGMSGIGGGVADLTQRANLTALVFAPIGNTGFPAVDGQKVVIYGPNGVTMENASGACKIDISPTTINITAPTTITLTAGGKTLTINSGGVTIDGKVWESHVHGGVQTGGGNTGPPV